MTIDASFSGLAGFSQSTPNNSSQSASGQNMSDPRGNIVDNSQNYNPVVTGDSTHSPIKPTQHQGSSGGGYLRSMSMPKSLSDSLMK